MICSQTHKKDVNKLDKAFISVASNCRDSYLAVKTSTGIYQKRLSKMPIDLSPRFQALNLFDDHTKLLSKI